MRHWKHANNLEGTRTMTPEQQLHAANERDAAYALTTTNLAHAKVMLNIAKQYKSDPAYIARLERHIEQLGA